MSKKLNRRQFVKCTAAAGVAAGALSAASWARAAQGPNEMVNVAVLGMSRGLSLAVSYEQESNAQVAYVCEPDANRGGAGVKKISQVRGRTPKLVADFRRALDDKDVDAIVVATPDHWHAPAGILGMVAGKHCYVEKPCCHNPHEGELLVEASRKHKRVCQMGNQRRSWPKIQEGIALVHGGEIGRVYYSRSWYANSRGPTRKGTQTKPPANLNWEIWQGPAPRRPYFTGYHPYNWHWYWHWGTGEMGNNGIHAIDLSRWGLQVDYPTRCVAAGGRYRFDDDQQTPDTHVVTLNFPGKKSIMWEGLSCSRLGIKGGFGADFHGEKGSITLSSSGYTLYDGTGREKKTVGGPGSNTPHVQNFIECIKSGKRPNSDIEGGFKSTLLCHLGNIAYRVGRSLTIDDKTGHILNDAEATGLWSREYEPGWEPKV